MVGISCLYSYYNRDEVIPPVTAQIQTYLMHSIHCRFSCFKQFLCCLQSVETANLGVKKQVFISQWLVWSYLHLDEWKQPSRNSCRVRGCSLFMEVIFAISVIIKNSLEKEQRIYCMFFLKQSINALLIIIITYEIS